MTAITNLAGATTEVLQEVLGAYTDEAYTNAKKLSGTGLVGGNPNIDVNTETFIGQARWYQPMTPTVNVASLTDSGAGSYTAYTSDMLKYVKSVRNTGATKVNMRQVVTQTDGLAKYGRDFGEFRAQDEHNALLAILKGVAISEALIGAGSAGGDTGTGGQNWGNDPSDALKGFYVDLGDVLPITAHAAGNEGA